ncbi:hypothetical protein [Candidatus Spongiihabitans sp.]|uniref:hypothetical protein n=1 Tax=Candidatus Spongiihabitans sp. TaxID=3101308 RepID=UPI003C6EF41B
MSASVAIILGEPTPPPSISVSVSTLIATVGVEITSVTIDPSGGGAVDSYSVSPTIANQGLILTRQTAASPAYPRRRGRRPSTPSPPPMPAARLMSR